MADTTQQTVSEAHEPAPHAYDAPGLSPRAFLLAIMRDRDAAIRDRVRAASTLLRLFGNDGFGPPRLTIVIGGIPVQEDHSYPLDGKNRAQQSFSSSASHSSTAHDGHTLPLILRRSLRTSILATFLNRPFVSNAVTLCLSPVSKPL
jgi:hypothetical protein